MKVVNQYIIPFKGLTEGEHRFDFQIEDAFFEENSSLEINSGSVKAVVFLDKKSNFLELSAELNGSVEVKCDRCLDNFTFAIDFADSLYVKFKEEVEEPDDNVIFLHPSDDELDLHQYFLDCIGLSLPIQKFHPEDEEGNWTCNSDMLDKLDEYSDREREIDENNIDPRWSKLKDLLNDGNKN